MSPDEVETIAMPRPPRTRGISVFRAYTRRPGRLIRRMPETADVLPPMYFRVTTSWVPAGSTSLSFVAFRSLAASVRYGPMNPSAFKIRAISIFTRLEGIITVSWRAPEALRIRVSMSPTGSFTATPRGRRAFGTITRRGRGPSASARSGRGAWGSGVVIAASVVISFSPARFRHARQLADERALAEADPAQAELAHVGAGPAAHLAAVV